MLLNKKKVTFSIHGVHNFLHCQDSLLYSSIDLVAYRGLVK